MVKAGQQTTLERWQAKGWVGNLAGWTMQVDDASWQDPSAGWSSEQGWQDPNAGWGSEQGWQDPNAGWGSEQGWQYPSAARSSAPSSSEGSPIHHQGK